MGYRLKEFLGNVALIAIVLAMLALIVLVKYAQCSDAPNVTRCMLADHVVYVQPNR